MQLDSPKDFLEFSRKPTSADFLQDRLTTLLDFPDDINVALNLASDQDIHRGMMSAIHAIGLKHSVPTAMLKVIKLQLYSLQTILIMRYTHYRLCPPCTILTIHCHAEAILTIDYTHYRLYSLYTILTIHCHAEVDQAAAARALHWRGREGPCR
jgi:hypothetical protein